jgi:hypothetical protein
VDTRGEKVTFVNSETLSRDRTMINGKDARSLISFVIITFVDTFVILVSGNVAVSSCGFSTRAFAFYNLV